MRFRCPQLALAQRIFIETSLRRGFKRRGVVAGGLLFRTNKGQFVSFGSYNLLTVLGFARRALFVAGVDVLLRISHQEVKPPSLGAFSDINLFPFSSVF